MHSASPPIIIKFSSIEIKNQVLGLRNLSYTVDQNQSVDEEKQLNEEPKQPVDEKKQLNEEPKQPLDEKNQLLDE